MSEPYDLSSRCRREGSCFVFVGSTSIGGYGTLTIKRKRVWAHRLAWEIENQRPVPQGLFVLHHCDNPPCCNPAHLFLGTLGDNVRDAVRKGRAFFGDKHPCAKLTNAQVLEIYQDARAPHEIAKVRKISPRQVSAIKTGSAWSNITGHPRRYRKAKK